jgi:hemerythrin-like domain-containing protein
LPQGHVLQRLLVEHQVVQCLLVDLVKLNNAISKLGYMSPTSEEYTRLLHIVSHLSGGEQHIQIEEKVIFPEVEKAGMAVLPAVLSAEHFDLRYYTQQLQELVYRCCTLDFDEFKRSLDRIVSYIVPLKQEHIFKEDNMLYPIAFGLIKEETAWRQLHVMWEQDGYSSF